MKRWMHITRIFLAVLLILQMSAASALPAGLHLNLCFGSDGHIDIAPDDCSSHPVLSHQWANVDLNDDDHHDDCLDVAFGCVSLDRLVSSVEKIRVTQAKNSNDDSQPITGNYFHAFSHPSIQPVSRSSSPPNFGNLPPSHIVSLRTIVLLI